MITKIILSILIILSFNCQGQNKNILDEEVYDVINFILKNGTVKYHKNLRIVTEDPNIRTDRFFNKELLNNFFDNENSNYILEQFSSSKDFLLNYRYISNMQIIHLDKMLSYKKLKKGLWSFLAERYKEEGFVFVGKPLFTIDKKRAVISYGYYCGGLCGSGYRVILKKINKTWMIEKEISGFIN